MLQFDAKLRETSYDNVKHVAVNKPSPRCNDVVTSRSHAAIDPNGRPLVTWSIIAVASIALLGLGAHRVSSNPLVRLLAANLDTWADVSRSGPEMTRR